MIKPLTFVNKRIQKSQNVNGGDALIKLITIHTVAGRQWWKGSVSVSVTNCSAPYVIQ